MNLDRPSLHLLKIFFICSSLRAGIPSFKSSFRLSPAIPDMVTTLYRINPLPCTTYIAIKPPVKVPFIGFLKASVFSLGPSFLKNPVKLLEFIVCYKPFSLLRQTFDLVKHLGGLFFCGKRKSELLGFEH